MCYSAESLKEIQVTQFNVFGKILGFGGFFGGQIIKAY